MNDTGYNVPAKQVPVQAEGQSSMWLLVFVLMLVCLGMRLVGLMDLPIFGDESIYLRWAQLVRGEGVGNLPQAAGWHPWISLVDPKPPLHFWLLSIVYHWAGDPLSAARHLSVLIGVLSLPLTMLVGGELGGFSSVRIGSGTPIGGKPWGLLAAILAVFCPFIAFYQRLATADGIFVTESLLIVWLSLRWARLSFQTPSRGSWVAAICLGAALGASLMTRQGLSYTIFGMPIAAIAVTLWQRRADHRGMPLHDARGTGGSFLRPVVQLLVAGGIASLIWMPFLLAELPIRATYAAQERTGNISAVATGQDYFRELHRRVMYQDQFTGGKAERIAVAVRNLKATFWPGWTPRGDPNSGWFFFYLTPGVYLLAIAGAFYLALRHVRVFLLLALWAALMLAPVIFLGNTIFSRYVLAGVPPLLFAAAYLLGDLMAWLLSRRPPAGWIGLIVLWALVLAWPMKELADQNTHWRRQTLTESIPQKAEISGIRGDRYQYISGWTAGTGTRQAIDRLERYSKLMPIVVITGDGWGTPPDAVWAYLASKPSVTLYYSDSLALQKGNEPGSYRLREGKYLPLPPRDVVLPHDAAIFYVLPSPVHASQGDISGQEILQMMGPNLVQSETFNGVEDEGVMVLVLKP